jgi:hypothetical protein
MREFGKSKDVMEPVRVGVEHSFPANPVNGEVFYSDALIRKGLHVFYDGVWTPLAVRGETTFVDIVLSAPVKVYSGIRTKMGLHYAKVSNWLPFDQTTGHFIVPRERAGAYLVMAQVTHDATNGNLFIMRNGEIIGFSSNSHSSGITTQTVHCVEELHEGDAVQLFFMTMDDEATVYNDYHNTRMHCVRLK